MGLTQPARIITITAVSTVVLCVIADYAKGLQHDHSSGGIGPNPVLEELERRAQAAEKTQVQTEKEKKQAEKFQRQAEEQQRAAEERCWREDAQMYRQTGEERKEDCKARLKLEKAQRTKREAEQRVVQAQNALQLTETNLITWEKFKLTITPTAKEIAETKARLKYRDGLFHFAVAGNSGCGKSSLINALRGCRNRDRNAAPTGVIETTSVIARYPDPNPMNPFVWYDVPGAGTLTVPDWTYFKAQGLYVFDSIIVLIDSRFTAADIAILQHCRRLNIPTYIVRSKSDQHIRNIMEDLGYSSGDEDVTPNATKDLYGEAVRQYATATRASVRSNLEAAEMEQQCVYLVKKDDLVNVVTGNPVKCMLDELELVKDILTAAHIGKRSQSARELVLSKGL